MRVALIADIHGNRFALDAVLDELERDGITKIVCLGDVAVGPQPTESVERVRALGCPVVMGNWDAYFVAGFPEPANELAQRLTEIAAWWAEQLTVEQREYMEGFQHCVELDLDGDLGVLAYHGSPRSYEDFVYATTGEEDLETMLDGTRAPVIALGHTHFQMVRRHRERLLINPGSVGLPFARPAALMTMSPWAEYGILSVEDGRLSVDLRRTPFDVEGLISLIVDSGMPHAEWWASLWRREEHRVSPAGPLLQR
jgi:predicted phosphodiesterase